MPDEHHERRFSPEKMAKLDSEMRRRMQPPEAVCRSLALEPGMDVVDLGVGTGFFAIPIAAELRRLDGDGTVIGLDVEPKMLEEAGRRAAAAGLERWVELRSVSGDGDIPLPDRSVDGFPLCSGIGAHTIEHHRTRR